jgi:hypothetical protein
MGSPGFRGNVSLFETVYGELLYPAVTQEYRRVAYSETKDIWKSFSIWSVWKNSNYENPAQKGFTVR